MAAPILFLATEGCKRTDGAANAGGTVGFRYPGTQTQATVYSNSAGTAILSQPVTLDGYGKADVFVTTVVDMDIYDSAGALVKTIERATAVHSGQVDVESLAFTGTSTSTGQQVTGGRASLVTAESAALTSFGGADFKYLDSPAGTQRPVRAVLRERGLSIKDRGAVGDGLTVDTVAIKEAIALLKASGGGSLLIPPGTYLVDDELLVDFTGLSIVGYGINISILKLTSASTNLIKAWGTGINFSIQGVQLTGSTTTSGSGLLSNAQGCIIRDVKITQNFAAAIKLDDGAFATEISHCNLGVLGAAGVGVLITGATVDIALTGDNYIYGSSNEGIGVDLVGAYPISDIAVKGAFMQSLGTGIRLGSTTTGFGLRISDVDVADCTVPYNFGRSAHAAGITEMGNTVGSHVVTEVVSATPTTAILTLAGTYTAVLGNSGTAITTITIADWRVGSVVYLVFADILTLKHATVNLKLAGAADFVSSAGDTLTLIYTGLFWFELARTVI